MKLSSCFWLILAFPLAAFAAESIPVKKGAVEVQLVSDASAIEPGKPITIGLRMKHDPHWHSYWIAPGTGYATSLTWSLPEGFKAGEIQWPTPHVVKDSSGKITGNGYEGEVFMLVDITPPATLAPGSTVKLKAVAEWLMCETVCMPGDAALELSLPAGTAADDAKWTEPLTKARAQLTVANSEWAVSATHDDKMLTLRLTPKAGTTHQPT